MTGPAVTAHTLAPGEPGAPLVVLVHGLESAWTSWLPIAAELDPDWRLVALELPWRPGNDYRWRSRSAGDWLGEALDLLDATPDVLVAHSFGANATLELLCALDPRPGRLVALVCPLYRLPHHHMTWRMFDRARTMFFEHLREGLRVRMGGRVGAVEPGVLEAMMDVLIDRVGPLGFLATFHQYTASSHLMLGNIDAATFVIAGGTDPTLVPEAAHLLASGIRGAEVRITDEYDHFCHVRHARGVATLIADFVDSARASTGTVGRYR